jgi:transposase
VLRGCFPERCRAILRWADGLPSKSVAAELGLHEHTVGKSRRRFLKDRCDGLLDEARPGRPRTINDDQVAAMIDRTLRTTPAKATQWLIRSMAAETGFSRTTIRRMWSAFGLQPHRSQTFKLSSDPRLVDKARDIVGFTCPRRTEPLSSASMRKARFRHSIASSRSCQ